MSEIVDLEAARWRKKLLEDGPFVPPTIQEYPYAVRMFPCGDGFTRTHDELRAYFDNEGIRKGARMLGIREAVFREWLRTPKAVLVGWACDVFGIEPEGAANV